MRSFRAILLELSIIGALFAGWRIPEIRVNVRDLGARGDGVADDTEAIRRAIAAVRPDGGTVYLPCGTYRVSSGLTIATSHTTLMSDGDCATLKMTGTNGFVLLTVRGRGLDRPVALTRDATSNTFTTTSGGFSEAGIVEGSYAIVSDTEVASNGEGSPPISTQQVVRIAKVEGDQATIEGHFAHIFSMISPHPSNQGCCPYVQKIIAPIEDVKLLHLTIDGSANSGTSAGAVQFIYAVRSEIGFLSARGFLQSPGPTNTFLLDTGFENTFHDIQCDACGSGAHADGHALAIRRQTLAVMKNIRVQDLPTQSVFSFNLASVNYSDVDRVVVDGGGANGRPFKLLRSNWNTFRDVTAERSGHHMNGFSITDMSTHNRFIHCTALDNDGTGIMMFGNFNDHNVFEDCRAERNSSSQFGQGQDAYGNFGDDFTTIRGGAYCCDRGDKNLIQINSNDFSMIGAVVSDDRGRALNGVVIRGLRSVVKDNQFSGLQRGQKVVYLSE